MCYERLASQTHAGFPLVRAAFGPWPQITSQTRLQRTVQWFCICIFGYGNLAFSSVHGVMSTASDSSRYGLVRQGHKHSPRSCNPSKYQPFAGRLQHALRGGRWFDAEAYKWLMSKLLNRWEVCVTTAVPEYLEQVWQNAKTRQ